MLMDAEPHQIEEPKKQKVEHSMSARKLYTLRRIVKGLRDKEVILGVEHSG